MESNKYYTPKIEEFYHGFEYEVWYNSAYTEEKWIKEIFEFYDKNEIYHYDCVDLIPQFKNNGDSIRVKYLDKEDIENLGWEEKSVKYYFKELPPSYPYHLYAILDFRWGLNDISIDVIRNYEYRDSDEEQRIFRGIIKNKSELKKLMKQLGINDIK